MLVKFNYKSSILIFIATLMNGLIVSVTNAANAFEPPFIACAIDDEDPPLYRFRLVADLNADGTPDYLFAKSPCGNAGCHFAVFLSADGEHNLVDFVFFHPKAARLQTTKTGPATLQAYLRKNATEGVLTTYHISDAGVEEVATEVMKPRDTDGDRYDELFRSGNSPGVERGTCQESSIAWEPN